MLLAVLILPYFQKWLVQRSQIDSARSQVSQAQQDVAQLEAERRRWQDEEYVRAQARSRLNYVMPGEIGFVVQDAPEQASSDPREQAAKVARGDKTPWYSDLWNSAQVAGQEASGGR